MTEPGSLAWEREQARARLDARSRDARLRRQSIRVLERHWDATDAQIIERIGELYRKMDPEGRAELLAYALRIQITERPRIPPEALAAKPPVPEIRVKPATRPMPVMVQTTTDDPPTEEPVMVRTYVARAKRQPAREATPPPPVATRPPDLGNMSRAQPGIRRAIADTIRVYLSTHPNAVARDIVGIVAERNHVSITAAQAKYLRGKVEEAKGTELHIPAPDASGATEEPIDEFRGAAVAAREAREALETLQVGDISSMGGGVGETVSGKIADTAALNIASQSVSSGSVDRPAVGDPRRRKLGVELKKRTAILTGAWSLNVRFSGLTRAEVRRVEDLIEEFHCEREAACG